MSRTWLDSKLDSRLDSRLDSTTRTRSLGRAHGRRNVRWAAVVAAVATVTGGMSVTGRAEATTAADRGSLRHIATVVGAQQAYLAGLTGKGVGVAMIDTGIAPVPGLASGNVLRARDLSFDAAVGGPLHLDAFGHGTHIGSIISGRDAVDTPGGYAVWRTWHGIAPDATLYSVKVGAADGGVDISQVIAAIDYVVEHRNDAGRNIRVINLSYGTDSLQSPSIDPLAFAVENAWKHGIVVVTAAGNDGRGTEALSNPASDPHVLAVSAADTQGTVTVADDTVPDWVTRGTTRRHADLVAPGVSVLGLRDPGSHIDEAYPTARVNERFFRGTGTSQATAVVSGVVALLLSRYPALTPNQVKALLMQTATPFASAGPTLRGNGMVNLTAALRAAPTAASRTLAPVALGVGTGLLDASRGTHRVADNDVPLVGEFDVRGLPWNGPAWAARTAAGTAWDGDRWNGVRWPVGAWDGTSWSGQSWTGRSWVGRSWVGRSWVGGDWTGRSWVGRSWVGSDWTGRSWVGRSWVGRSWVSSSWESSAWR